VPEACQDIVIRRMFPRVWDATLPVTPYRPGKRPHQVVPMPPMIRGQVLFFTDLSLEAVRSAWGLFLGCVSDWSGGFGDVEIGDAKSLNMAHKPHNFLSQGARSAPHFICSPGAT
jgi:hypothetical protein